jgi:hypothetical protein
MFDQDFFTFRKMILPTIIQVLFWIGVVFVVVWGIAAIAADPGDGWQVGYGVVLILIGPIIVRVYCEFLVVVFRILDALTDIRRDITRLVPQTATDRKVCPKCGKESPLDAAFCRHCGQAL